MKTTVNTMIALSLLAIGFQASAGESFKEKHPRRAEVNQRARNEDKRIAQGLKTGKLTPAEAQQLKGEVAGVKAQEKAEVKANGGYLTKTEQKQLNQELNQDSKQIYAEKHGQ